MRCIVFVAFSAILLPLASVDCMKIVHKLRRSFPVWNEYEDPDIYNDDPCSQEVKTELTGIRDDLRAVKSLVEGLRQKLDPDLKLVETEEPTGIGSQWYGDSTPQSRTHALQRRSVRKSAAVGSSVVLDCDINYPSGEEVEHMVKWHRQDIDVPIYIQLNRLPPHVDTNYQGRLRRLDRASIEIDNLSTSDEGWYECAVIFIHPSDDINPNGTWIYLSVTSEPAPCPEGFEYLSEARGCYKVITERHDWSSAMEQCRSLNPNAHLISIESRDESEAVTKYLNNQFASRKARNRCRRSSLQYGYTAFWTSGQRVNVSDCSSEFVWKTTAEGEAPLNYTQWGDGEPNCGGGDEKCAELLLYRRSSWNDVMCYVRSCPLCEYDLSIRSAIQSNRDTL